MIITVNYNVVDFLPSTKDCVYLRSHHKYFEKELRKLPIEKLWEIVEELLSFHHVPDKIGMDYEQVLELCVILKEIDEMFRNLEQVAILKSELGKDYKL
ncbi:MAG: hypothetical protein KGI05_01435 [Thaumarchaeota archaeon]|nr:hypothetical protein [Nitrososphaerota archaeon]